MGLERKKSMKEAKDDVTLCKTRRCTRFLTSIEAIVISNKARYQLQLNLIRKLIWVVWIVLGECSSDTSGIAELGVSRCLSVSAFQVGRASYL